jgi:hypothetical protein
MKFFFLILVIHQFMCYDDFISEYIQDVMDSFYIKYNKAKNIW